MNLDDLLEEFKDEQSNPHGKKQAVHHAGKHHMS